MPQFRFALFISFLFLLNACVKPKIHNAEVASRTAAEARERVLVQELLDRKRETADLIKKVGELNRTIGGQEQEIKDLNSELANRTQKLGESSSKLVAEKSALERTLEDTKAELGRRNSILQNIQKAQQERKSALDELMATLTKSYAGRPDVTVTVEEESVLLTLPDKTLFDPKNGQDVSSSGKTLLAPLAQILTNRPELAVDVVCHTDNAPPKDKTLLDTWDWSLRRATNAVRMLVRDYNVNANQLTPVGRGEFFPITSNETAEGRQKNRRTAILIRPAMPKVPRVE